MIINSTFLKAFNFTNFVSDFLIEHFSGKDYTLKEFYLKLKEIDKVPYSIVSWLIYSHSVFQNKNMTEIYLSLKPRWKEVLWLISFCPYCNNEIYINYYNKIRVKNKLPIGKKYRSKLYFFDEIDYKFEKYNFTEKLKCQIKNLYFVGLKKGLCFAEIINLFRKKIDCSIKFMNDSDYFYLLNIIDEINEKKNKG